MSGKVNEVTYQPNQPDQFIHRYEYDADNRIKNVKTSRDDVFFDNDASYYYYLHGPLARVEIGEERVQGIDYVYTLQGWIKGVNSNSLDAKVDPGMDGDMSGSNHNFAKDAFGYTLNYFNGDYQAINPDKTSFETNFIAHTENFDNLAHDAPNLYNGNISSMATTIVNNKEYEVLPQFTMYKYDQLNRLKSMKAFADFNFERNAWEYDGYKGRYENNFEYDANGNILSLQRNNQAGVMFDNFTYQYQKIDNKMLSNRLYHVNDDVNMNSIMTDDIDDQGDFSEKEINTINNYGYDEIGNLKFDKVEGIDKIEWTAYSKVKNITRRDGYFKVINNDKVYPSNLEFLYDAMGNRIAKIEKPRDANGEKSSANWKTTYYIRDAQGNPMATYKQSSETEAASFKLIERPMYGSSRVGIDNYSLEFVGYTPPTNNLTSHILGLKQYELSNHLGNVLTTISDKKFPIDNNGLIDHYVADITSVSDYYPFGSPMDGRTFGSEKYRYSFNTQEKVDEVYGKGNLNTALFWEYDTRLGRRWNLDPKPNPSISDYACFANNPIFNTDVLGDTVRNGFKDDLVKTEKTMTDKMKKYNESDGLSKIFAGISYKVSKIQHQNVKKDYDKVEKLIKDYSDNNKEDFEKINSQSVDVFVTINRISNLGQTDFKIIRDEKNKVVIKDNRIYVTINNTTFNKVKILGHEFGHAYFTILNPVAVLNWQLIYKNLDTDGHYKCPKTGMSNPSGLEADEWENRTKF